MTKAIIEQLVDAMNKHGSPYLGHIEEYQAALIAAREYLAQPNTQEPSAWMQTDCIGERFLMFDEPYQPSPLKDKVDPLFTHPATQQKPLTDEQIFGICENSNVPYKQPYFEVNRFTDVEEMLYHDSSIFSPLKFARAIEAAHNIKG